MDLICTLKKKDKVRLPYLRASIADSVGGFQCGVALIWWVAVLREMNFRHRCSVSLPNWMFPDQHLVLLPLRICHDQHHNHRLPRERGEGEPASNKTCRSSRPTPGPALYALATSQAALSHCRHASTGTHLHFSSSYL